MGEPGSAGEHAARLDRETFARLYRDAYPALRLVAAAEVGRSDADDVVQKAAIVALERTGRFTPGTDFRAWMAALVRGVARNHRRSSKRRDARLRSANTRGPVPDAPPPIPPGSAGEAHELDSVFDERVRNALETLEPQPRACLLLRVVLEYSYSEIGAIVGIPEATARSHVFRARKKMLHTLGPGTDGPDGGADGA